MNRSRHQDPLAEAFAKLPRQRSSADFTQEVLESLDRRGPGHYRAAGRLVWASAATLVLVSLLALGYGYQRQQAAEQAYQDQVDELKARYQELLQEVATVRQEVQTPDTRLYLGGNENVDLVLDLAQTPTYQEAGQDRRDIQPAAWEKSSQKE